ncbi:FG-nucleoporin nsp1 [Coemansia spiralis]|nr:FG-nucleoporin nsp1 [Coemansia spiralis]
MFGSSGTGGGFGSSGTGSSIFGASGGTSQPEAPKSIFGASATSTGTTAFGSLGASKPEASKPSLTFGGTTTFGGFGAPAASSGLGSGASTTTAFPSFGGTKDATAPAATTGGIFGSKPAETSTAGGFKPPASGMFGGFGASTQATSAASTVFAPAATTAAATSAAASASAPLFGSTSSATAPAGGFGFGPTKPLSLSSFGAKRPTDDEKADAPGAENPTAGTGLGGFKLSTAPATGLEKGKAAEGTTAASTAGLGSAAAKAADKNENSTDIANGALRGKTLEEIAQMWTAELAVQTRAFHTQASTVGYWDRALVQQGKRITELYEATMGVESEQAALDQNLEHMEGQQSALQNLLDAYEGRVQDIVRKTTTRPAAGKGVAMTADQERDHVYSSAERLNQQLDELARRLTGLVEDVNGVSAATAPAGDGPRGAAADPFAQIVQILNAHLTSLEWVDTQTTQLQERLKTAQRVYQDVAAAQSSLSGTYGAPGAGDLSSSAPQDGPITIPGAFVTDQPPPVMSSFGTPLGSTTRKPLGASLLGRTGMSSSFASTPQRR